MDDNGPGSMNQAILDANANSGRPDVIMFNIPGTGPHTFQLGAILPPIMDRVFIEGSTQYNFSGTPLIEFDGINVSTATCLDLQSSAGSSAIKNISIFRYNTGIVLFGDGNTIQGNIIGTNASDNPILGNDTGILISGSDDNTIGGLTSGEGNIISGNTGSGIRAQGNNNSIQGNYIGTTNDGQAALGNNVGVYLSGSGSVFVGPDNVISGNVNYGVRIMVGSGHTVSGNYIGTDASGLADLGTQDYGVYIDGISTGNTIGGPLSLNRNVIAGHDVAGIALWDDGPGGNDVLRNAIGVDATGTNALPNNVGIEILRPGNTIGANVISGNANVGISIQSSGTNTQVVSNYIGTDETGTLSLPNSIGIVVSSSDNTIGGNSAAEGNTIAYNTGKGIIIGSSAVNNGILSNSIFSNGDLGIDLANNGVTFNDAGDGDSGANNLQNYPVLTAADSDPVSIQGTLNSTPNENFTIQFFYSADFDPSGYGEGENFLGEQSVSTDGSGNAIINASFATTIPAGSFISATATDLNFNTSEFSQVITATGTLTLTVTNTDDDGAGSLRAAMEAANANPGLDLIEFDIPGAGPHTIQPLSLLPEITDSVRIDGYTQTGAFVNTNPPGGGTNAVLMIVLDGSSLTGPEPSYRCLHISGGNSTIRGLVINHFSGEGIIISGNEYFNYITGNFIGTDYTGTTSEMNGGTGIRIEGSANHFIGTGDAADKNVISANGAAGIEIELSGATGNYVLGNLIGVDATGLNDMPNNWADILLNNGASGNFIGGTTAGERNVFQKMNISFATDNQIMGNFIGVDVTGNNPLDSSPSGSGIFIINASDNYIGPSNVISGQDSGIILTTSVGGETAQNRINGNFIGTNHNGQAAVPNNIGIYIQNNAHRNEIGVSQRNIISGNSHAGVLIEGNLATQNHVVNNYIGTDISGTLPMGNEVFGIHIADSEDNTIRGNVVSANGGVERNPGILLSNGTTNTTIMGNKIGTDFDGDAALKNSGAGIALNNSPGNFIGNQGEVDRNIIFGGIELGGAGTTGNQIVSNYIGPDATGNVALDPPNAEGISIGDGATSNVIGPGNILSGINPGNAIAINDQNTQGNEIIGNYFGVKADGTGLLSNRSTNIAIVNADSNIIGGLDTEDRNIISGSLLDYGIAIHSNSTGNQVLGNYIGTNTAGDLDWGNAGEGILLDNADKTLIRGNLISGNGTHGITITNDSDDNTVSGNFIGTDVTGTGVIGNSVDGITISDLSSNNTIGGTSAGAGNIISGNLRNGVTIRGGDSNGNLVQGNFIGTDITGTVALGNALDGISMAGGTANNTIGGTVPGARNVISGNGGSGIGVVQPGTSGNIVQGNYIGTNAHGTSAIPNVDGIWFGEEAANNIIGGLTPGARNVISGNNQFGISINNPGTSGNLIQGNAIGTDVSEGLALPNDLGGIVLTLNAGDNVIGGLEGGAGNTIAFNQGPGVKTHPDAGTGNAILGNSIYSNGFLGIDLSDNGVTQNDLDDADTGPNNYQNFPVLNTVEFSAGYVTIDGSLNSTPSTEFTLQFFANQIADGTGYGEGETLLGTEVVTTDAGGDIGFNYTLPILVSSGQVITATATDPAGNTSEFSLSAGGAQRQILGAANMPFHYVIHEDGDPMITNPSDLDAVRGAFASWDAITTADIDFVDDGTTPVRIAASGDGINLVTFSDDEFPFPPGVLAIAAKTIRMDASGNPAEILDADIVFNPYWVNHNTYHFATDESPGYFDIQSIATHEVGHVLGLIHTGVLSASMFYLLGDGTEVRSLETDDIAWASVLYPKNPEYDATFGCIEGTITEGYTGAAVAGALVLAQNTVSEDSVHTYSDENGHYNVPGLETGTYKVSIEPLDGDVNGFGLTPAFVSPYVNAIATIMDFPNEYYDSAESDIEEDPAAFEPVSVTAGGVTDAIDLITNRDQTSPEVLSVSPEAGAADIDVFPQILIVFSEPMDLNTIHHQTMYLTIEPSGDIVDDLATYSAIENKEKIVYTPGVALEHDAAYTLHINDAVADRRGNTLGAEVTSGFSTKAADILAPEVTGTIPESGATGVFITAPIKVFFSEHIDPATLEQGFTVSAFGLPDVSGTISMEQQYTVMTFVPSQSLAEATTYSINLSTEVKDLSGNGLAIPYTSSFTTVASAAPVITYLGPSDQATDVTPLTPVVADFSEPIDPATVNETTFFLHDDSNNPVTGAYDFLRENARVVFRPTSELAGGSTYTFHITTGIRDVSDPSEALDLGAGVDELTHQFTTTATLVAPHIDYIDPPAGVEGATVVITGQGFDPDPALNTVHFSGLNAPVIASTLTTVTTKIPVGATSGLLTIEVDGQTSNAVDFYVIMSSQFPNDHVVANLSTDQETQDVDFTPDGAYAYVTNSGAGTVSVINMETNSILPDPILVGIQPQKVAINPQGTRAYVTNFGSHTVSVIDIDITSVHYNQVMDEIPVGINPIGVAVTPDGKRVYVANFTSLNVSVIDVDETSGGYNHVVANIHTDSENQDIDFGPDGGKALVTGGTLWLIDTDPESDTYNTVVANVYNDSDTRDVDFSPDGFLAIVTTMDGRILIIDLYENSSTYGTVVANIQADSDAHDVDFGPDGLFVYITNLNDNQVSVYELSFGTAGGETASPSYPADLTLVLVNTIPVGDAPKGVAVDPYAQRVVVANSGSNSVTIINISTGLSPEQAVEQLIDNVHDLVDSGILGQKDAKNLLKKLGNALDKLEKGNEKAAINQLLSFIHEMEKLVADGVLLEADAQPLIEDAQAIISQLVVSLEEAIEALIDEVQTMVFDGDLSQADADRLIGKLEKSLEKLDRGQVGAAIGQLEAFIQIVGELEDEGVLSASDADQLEGTANAIIDQLEQGLNRPTDLEEALEENLPSEFMLGQNYPNPFNASTTIAYDVPSTIEIDVHVTVKVYDVMGRVVATLVGETKRPGRYSVHWDGISDTGLKVSSGIYFIRMDAATYTAVKKLVLVQ